MYFCSATCPHKVKYIKKKCSPTHGKQIEICRYFKTYARHPTTTPYNFCSFNSWVKKQNENLLQCNLNDRNEVLLYLCMCAQIIWWKKYAVHLNCALLNIHFLVASFLLQFFLYAILILKNKAQKVNYAEAAAICELYIYTVLAGGKYIFFHQRWTFSFWIVRNSYIFVSCLSIIVVKKTFFKLHRREWKSMEFEILKKYLSLFKLNYLTFNSYNKGKG